MTQEGVYFHLNNMLMNKHREAAGLQLLTCFSIEKEF